MNIGFPEVEDIKIYLQVCLKGINLLETLRHFIGIKAVVGAYIHGAAKLPANGEKLFQFRFGFIAPG